MSDQNALRQRYADALRTCANYSIVGEVDAPTKMLDAIMAVRDDEIAELRKRLAKAEKLISGVANMDTDAMEIAFDDLHVEAIELRQRAEQAEAVVARAELLRDKWLHFPEGDMHYAAGLMLACYLDGTAYGSDEPRPAAEAAEPENTP